MTQSEASSLHEPAPDVLLLENALAIATLNEGHAVLRKANVRIENNVITAVDCEQSTSNRSDIGRVIDCSNMVLVPGLVNTHHHLFQTLFRAVPEVQDAELFPWLTHLYTLWQWLDEEAVYVSAKLGFSELLLTGCTTTTDHFYPFPRHGKADLVGALVKAAQETGIRFHPSRGSMSLGTSSGGLPPDALTQDEDVILADCERVAKAYHDPSPMSMCRVVFSPCSPFSVSPDLLEKSAELGRKMGIRLHTHLAETLDEEQFCLEKFGKRPLAYMEDLGWTGDDVWYAHGIHFNEGEIEILGKTRTGVAHCPSSNMRLGSGAAPIRKLLDAGAPVGIAVDGSASNDSSDMLGEVRQAMLLARLTSGVTSMPALDALSMGTLGGAALLGRDDIGRIAPGMAADIVGIDTRKIGYAGAMMDPVAAILFAGDSHLVDLNVVNGKVLVEKGRLNMVDEDDLVKQANAVAAGMIEKARKKS